MTAQQAFRRQRAIILIVFIAYLLALSFLTFAMFFIRDSPGFLRFGYIVAAVLSWAMSAYYLLIGGKIINADEIGLVLLLGRPLFQVSSGFIFVPPPWNLQRESRLVIDEQFPDESAVKAGTVAPMTITHGQSAEQNADALGNRVTTTASIVCRYKIVDLLKFVTTIGNRDQLKRQVRDVAVTTAQVECSKHSVSSNLARLPEINASLKLAITALTSDWGIEIVAVLLQNIDLGGAINEALRSLPVAVINKEVSRHNAQKIYFDGAAQAEVTRAFAFAKAEGYKAIAAELNIAEPVVLYQIDALAAIWRKNNAEINLIGGDMAEIFKMITAFKGISDEPKKLV